MDDKHATFNTKIFYSLLWIVSLIISVVIGYAWGHGNKDTESTQIQTTNASQISVTSTPSPQITSSMIPTSIAYTPTPSPIPNVTTCNKTGYAQKWEYLTPYVVKQGDTVQNIAKEQLKDETRVNEILQINGVGLVVGATVYLPPPTISKSSGNIKQVYGKLMEKNNTSWHIGFSSDPKGQGILIPSFWFEGISNRDVYKVGDCIKVFFDEGFKVYSVDLQ